MKERKLPKMIIIEPGLMIHDYGLKGIDLLLFGYISSCYNITAKAVTFNRSYVADMLGCSRRQVINALNKMIDCGILVKYGDAFVPANQMTKGHSVKKVHTPVKKFHTINILRHNNEQGIKEISKEKKEAIEWAIRIANIPWLDD